MGGRGGGRTQNIMRALCAVMRPDHLKFASYGPALLRGGSRGGGAWGAHASPFGTEPARNAEVCHALAHVATLTQCTSLILYMNHCFMSCIHRALKSAASKLKRQFCGSASNTKADSEGKGLRETTIRRMPEFTLQLQQIL